MSSSLFFMAETMALRSGSLDLVNWITWTADSGKSGRRFDERTLSRLSNAKILYHIYLRSFFCVKLS